MHTEATTHTPRCACCRRPLRHTEGYACQPCQQRMDDTLAWLPAAYTRLADYLERGSRGEGGPVSGSRHAPLPAREAVLTLRGPGGDAIVGRLLVHEDAWRAALGWSRTPWRGSLEQTLPGVVAFLRNNLLWACGAYPDIDDLHRDLRTLRAQIQPILSGDRPEQPIRVQCADPTAAGCTTALRIYASTVSRECPGCGHHYDHEALLDLPLAQRRAAA